MPNVKARINTKTKEIRCGLVDCNALLMKGEITQTEPLEIKCKCGVTNDVIAPSTVHKPEGPATNSLPYQDRLGMSTKGGGKGKGNKSSK